MNKKTIIITIDDLVITKPLLDEIKQKIDRVVSDYTQEAKIEILEEHE